MPTANDAVWVSVLPDMSKFTPAMVTGVGAASAPVESRMGKLGKKAGLAMGVAAAAGAVIFAKKAVSLEAEFSKTMNKFQASTDLPAAGMKRMQDLALKMGADTVFSASEASDAMLAMAKSGLKPATIEAGGLNAALTLAAAGELEMGTAAEVMSNALNTFSLKGKDAAAVSAALAGAANASSASVESLAQGLQQVGTVAADAGFTVQETTGAMAALANAGIAGSDAGTSLKTMFANLQPATKAARDAFESFGLSSYQSTNSMKELEAMGIKPVSSSMPDVTNAIRDYVIRSGEATEGTMKLEDRTKELLYETGMMQNAFIKTNGEFKSLGAISGVLQEKFAGLSSSERAAALQTLFGSDARRAATVLTKEGADGLAKYVKATSDAGAADKMAAAGMKGTAGALEELSGSIETVTLRFGLMIAPYVQKGLIKLKDAVNALPGIFENVSKFVRENAGAIKALAVTIGVAVAVTKLHATVMAVQAAGGLLAMFKATKLVTTATKVYTAFQWLLNAALRANPIGIVITALAALGTALVLAYKKSDTFRKIVDKAWSVIKKTVGDAWDKVIKPALKAFADYMTDVLFPTIKFMWSKVVKPTFTGIGKTIKTVWTGVIKPAFNALKDGVGSVKDAFGTAIDAVARIWERLKGIVMAPVRFVIDTVINKGLIAGFNSISEKVNGPTLDPIRWLGNSPGQATGPSQYSGDSRGLATGGVLPGWTPGRDVHHFTSPTAGRLHLSGGEAIMRPEFTRAMGGERGIADLNRKARMGRLHGPHRDPDRAFFLGGVFPVNPGADISQHSGYPWASWAGDLNVPGDETGNPVYAWKKGTVASAGWGGADSYGNVMRLNHAGQSSLYAHLSSFIAKAGQDVAAGQLIGRVGTTGNSSGPHLHFEVKGGNVAGGYGVSGSGGGISIPDWAQDLLGSAIGSVENLINGPLNALKSKFPNNAMAGLAAGFPTTLVSSLADFLESKVTGMFGSGSSSGASVAGISGPVVSQVQQVAERYGWGSGANWDSLKALVQQESSWNPNAANSTSSARGLFQKMTSIHGAVEPTAAGQAQWGLNYIKGRYGNPVAAWNFHQARGYYANGGVLPTFDQGGWLNPGMTGTNKSKTPEPVFTGAQWSTLKAAVNPTLLAARGERSSMKGLVIQGRLAIDERGEGMIRAVVKDEIRENIRHIQRQGGR